MRLMQIVRFPHKKFNERVRDGSAGPMMDAILQEIKPEAVYFAELNGQRNAIMIVEVSEPSKVPALAEPWFLNFEADVEFHIVMKPEELEKAGLDEIAKKWG